jgi:hypothetical protein
MRSVRGRPHLRYARALADKQTGNRWTFWGAYQGDRATAHRDRREMAAGGGGTLQRRTS